MPGRGIRARATLIAAALLTTVTIARSVPAGAAEPELPRATVDTTHVPPTGRTIQVAPGGSLQGALNAAQPGDVISLAAGAQFMGPFTLPKNPGDGWIIIRSSTPDSRLPPPGTRVTLAHAPLMPAIVGRAGSAAIQTAPGAHHFRFIGIEVRPAAGAFVYNLIQLGANERSENELPHHIIFDRCYIHGDPSRGGRRGIVLNSKSTAVIDSHVSDFKEVGADSQAIAGWNGPGPFTIVNNYLEGAGENLMFGGADPRVPNLVPADIEIRGNHFSKPLWWRVGHPGYAGTAWSIKNLLELKNARRVLITGNLFEHSWEHAQTGWAILFTVRNQEGGAPWSDVSDVTFARNIVRRAGSGVQMHGTDDNFRSQQTKRILIRDNLFDDINSAAWGGSGRLFQVAGGVVDVTIDHNTALHSGNVITSAIPTAPNTGFLYRNNITAHNAYGVIGDNKSSGNTTLATYFPGAVFTRNVLAGPWPSPGGTTISQYSNHPGNFFPASLEAVGFADLKGGDYRLRATSPYRKAGTDGQDLGADIEALRASGLLPGGPGRPLPESERRRPPARR